MKKTYIIFNSICCFFFVYFLLRLYSVFKKSLFVPEFYHNSDADYVFFILILFCVCFLGNIFIFLLDKFNKK